MSEQATTGQIKEMRQYMLHTNGKTGEQRHVFLYHHSNPLKNWWWHFRYGEEGERISEKEAMKFLPQ